MGKLGYSKLYAPFSLFFLGLCAWFCFRQWKFSPLVCVLGGLAAGLNSCFFSTACWGVAAQPIAFGLNFLAIGLLADTESPHRWVRVILAGFAVGMGVMEAFDIGAIFSLFVAAFVVFQAFIEPGPPAQRAIRGLARLATVAVFAGFIAAAALVSLVGTQIKGISGIDQPSETKQERWDWATQWSLPKREIIDVILPGIYGFRMDTPNGGNYWGAGGRDPAWEKYFASDRTGPPPGGPLRFSGGGHYAGILVVLSAAWALAQSFRRSKPQLPDPQRKTIWFWGGVMVVAMLLGFGRFAPFYQFFYMVPYASTIRNPAKFIHVFEWALVMLAAFGLENLVRTYLERPAAKARDLSTQVKTWWTGASAFEKKWVRGTLIALAIFLLGWLIYVSSSDRLVAYLTQVGFDAAMGADIAKFSVRQPGWPALFLALTIGLFILILSGFFGGHRAKIAGVLLGLILVVDLARANMPWAVTLDWKRKYATDPVVEFLRKNAYEHRVTLFPLERFVQLDKLPPEARALVDMHAQLRGYYQIEWMQHHFQYYDIQSLDIVQMPRVRVEYEAYLRALLGTPLRYWQLTNTRYLLGPAALLDLLNERIDPQKRFRVAMSFDLVPRGDVTRLTTYEDLTAVANTNGQYAVFEFTGALPRARLFTQWQVNTNDQAALKILASPEFNPEQTVISADPLPGNSSTNAAPGIAEITSYHPKHIVVKTRATAPSVLLYNDKHDPDWQVFIEGKPAVLLRCNFIARGVEVPTGDHTVEFRFQPSLNGSYVSAVAIAVAVLLVGFLVVAGRSRPAPPPTGS